MGLNLPNDRRQSLVWLEGRIDGWNTNFASIGLTSAQVTDLAGDIISTRTSFTSVQAARTEAKAETQSWYTNADELHTKAAELITLIKSFAANSRSSAAVYLAADMTPRNPPSPAPPPEQPGNLKATLNGDGTVTISWDGRGPTGTVYNVSRRLPAETSFAFIGQGDGRDKSFTDATVPTGSASALYIVQAVRGSDVSTPSSAFNVLFSSGDAGAASAAA